MSNRKVIAALVLTVAFAFPGSAAADVAAGWVPPPQGAAQMFQDGGRVFAVGAQSGGAGAAVSPTGTENLMPSPGGTPIKDARCAMEAGQCTGGVCVSYLSFYCKTDDCSGRKFC